MITRCPIHQRNLRSLDPCPDCEFEALHTIFPDAKVVSVDEEYPEFKPVHTQVKLVTGKLEE